MTFSLIFLIFSLLSVMAQCNLSNSLYLKSRFNIDPQSLSNVEPTLHTNQSNWFAKKQNIKPSQPIKYNYVYNWNELCGKATDNKAQKDQSNLNIMITPNPVKDELLVTIPRNNEQTFDQLSIIDVHGRSIYNSGINEQKHQIRINAANFPNGQYQCILTQKGNILARQKFVKIN